MQRLTAFLLSALLLLSSSGITYAEHFCGSHKMASEITLGHADLSCGMVQLDSDCDDEPLAMDCCDNHYLSIDTDDDYAKVAFEFDPLPDFDFTAPAPNELVQQSFDAEIPLAIVPYRPPPDSTPLYILFESYLI